MNQRVKELLAREEDFNSRIKNQLSQVTNRAEHEGTKLAIDYYKSQIKIGELEYNAESEEFSSSITHINGESSDKIHFSVPIKIARDFKQNSDEVRVYIVLDEQTDAKKYKQIFLNYDDTFYEAFYI